jgi:DNA-binding beta-propeller fold protein YncE/predicted Ser/Thr protein kinase
MAASADSRIGTELAGYRLEALLGRGGMGVVYRAHDLALDRNVALKILSPELAEDERFRERFLTESRLAASIDHPNIIPVYDAGEVAGELYIAMRYVDGSDLKKLLAEEPLPAERTVAIGSQVAGALDAAHERGLIHRDIKPSNVLLDERGHVYLADFGLSRRLGEQGAALGAAQSLGTIDYVAPEQIRGEEVDGRADLYSLGCLLYECVTGNPPFARSTDSAVLFAHLEEDPPAVPGLEDVMRTALAKEPDDRFQTGHELAEATRKALGIAEPRRSLWPVAAAAVGLVLICAALLGFFLTRGGGTPTALGGRLLRIDPVSNHVTTSVPVGDGPAAVAVGSGRVWVASYHDGTLWQLDPGSGGLTKVAAVGRPFALTTYDGNAYVAATGPGQFTGNVSKFDAVTGGRAGGKVMVACSIASGTYGVWVAGCPNVQKLSTEGATPRFLANVVIPFAEPLSAANYREALAGMAQGEGAVWVIGDAADRRLWRIDPQRHRITATIALGFPPGGVAAGSGAVWVTDELGDRVVKIDPATNRVVDAIPVGRGAIGVTVGAGSVWVADAIGHSLSRIDPATHRLTATIRVPASPRAVAVGEGSVWVVGDAR